MLLVDLIYRSHTPQMLPAVGGLGVPINHFPPMSINKSLIFFLSILLNALFNAVVTTKKLVPLPIWIILISSPLLKNLWVFEWSFQLLYCLLHLFELHNYTNMRTLHHPVCVIFCLVLPEIKSWFLYQPLFWRSPIFCWQVLWHSFLQPTHFEITHFTLPVHLITQRPLLFIWLIVIPLLPCPTPLG